MKVKIKIEQEVTLTTMEVRALMDDHRWESGEVDGVDDENGDLMPCREGDYWCPVIEIDTGTILNWKIGKTAKVHYKVVDCCGIKIDSIENGLIFEQDDYVPDILCPAESGYGDYIIMNIDANGKIEDWNKELIYELLNKEED